MLGWSCTSFFQKFRLLKLNELCHFGLTLWLFFLSNSCYIQEEAMFTFSVSACRLWNNLHDQARTIEGALAELKVVFFLALWISQLCDIDRWSTSPLNEYEWMCKHHVIVVNLLICLYTKEYFIFNVVDSFFFYVRVV